MNRNDVFSKKMEKIKKQNEQKLRIEELRQERNKYKKKVETSKFLALYLFVLLNAVIVYSMISMWKFSDLSYLGVLITDIAAQILIYGIYCLKAYKGKKSEEDIKLQREQLYYKDSPCEEASSQGNFME